jgi:hypothetical protein
MTDAQELLKLAERVEALTRPDRETDALIRCALFAADGAYVEQSKINGAWCVLEVGYNGKVRSWEPKGLSQEQRIGSFTASLDAALSLVPKGWAFTVARWWCDGDDKPLFYADCADLVKIQADEDGEIMEGRALTPALALTAAALRAMAAL